MIRTVREIEGVLQYRKTEIVKLVGGFLLVSVCAFFAAQMAGYGWRTNGLPRQLAYGLVDMTGTSPDVFFAFPVGLFTGLAVAMILDSYKRVQGFLLLVGVDFAAAALDRQNLLFGVIDWTDASVLLVAGVGALLSFGISVGWERYVSDPPYTYTVAVKAVFASVLAIAVLGFFEAFVRYQSPIVHENGGLALQAPAFAGFSVNSAVVVGAPFAALFVLLTYWFLGYESETEAVLLGPQRSGKTWLMTGLHYTKADVSLNETQIPTRPSDDMRTATEAFKQKNFDANILGGTDDNVVRAFKFEYTSGWLFPQQVTLRVLDYAGENLRELDCDAAGYTPGGTLNSVPVEYDPDGIDSVFEIADEYPRMNEDDVVSVVSDFVYYADRVGLIIPMDEFTAQQNARYDPNVYGEKYADLVDRFRTSQSVSLGDVLRGDSPRKDFFVVATKADEVGDRFMNDRGRDPDADPLEFRRYVQRLIGANSGAFGTLFEYPAVSNERVYATYFRIDENESKNLNNVYPVLDGNDGHDPLRGASELLDRLGR